MYTRSIVAYTSNGHGYMPRTVDLLQGTLDLLILKALSWGPAHGYAVARWLEQLTDKVLLVGEGSLYPALHRLEGRGWIESEWRLSERNRRAKFYRLTARGRQQLKVCLLYTSPSPRDRQKSRMPSSA